MRRKIVEMPCLCKCGEWFDLNDGFRPITGGGGNLVCPACHREEVEEAEKLEEPEGEEEEEL